MKLNKKIILIPIFIAVVVFFGVYYYYYREDMNSLTVTEKNWVEENITSLVDIEVITDYPIYGEKDGVFASFISGFESAAGVEFNQLSYLKEGTPNTKKYRFRALNTNEKLGENDLLINEDVYILVGKTMKTYDKVSDLSDLTIGVLSSDKDSISYYLSSGSKLSYKTYDDSDMMFAALDSNQIKNFSFLFIRFGMQIF